MTFEIIACNEVSLVQLAKRDLLGSKILNKIKIMLIITY